MTKRIFLSLLAIASCAGQSFQGSLRGRVSDPAGATASGVSVTLSERNTSAARKTVMNDQGDYVFTALTPSSYELLVEAPGFKRLPRNGIEVATQAAVTLDLNLELGSVSDKVEVTGEAPPLQTADASTGQTIDSRKVTDLPLLGSNPFFLGRLAQAVVFVANPKFARMQDQNGNSQVSIAGGPLRTNNDLIDGISIADSTDRAVILPSPEAVQDLKIQANTYDAEVGRTGGGTFNTLLRSGANEVHGSAVGHIRETDWLADNFFANRAGQPIADQPFRDWAFSLGGPLRIPKVYDGRNRTVFFITTEAYRQRDASTTVLSVPTALERGGDFSQSLNKNGSLQTIYDPKTTAADGTRQSFPGNMIPASRLNPVGLALASYYPNPNATTAYYGAPNYNFTGSYPNRGDQSTWKVDHQFASWLRASASYIHQKTFEVDAPTNILPNAAAPSQGLCCDREADATQANATIVPDATTVIAIRWGFNRFYSKSTQESAGFNLASLGLPASLVSATPNPAFRAITMSDVSSYGGGATNQDVFYSRSFNVTASKFIGKHTLKAGFDFRTLHDFGTPVSGPTSLSFSDVFTRYKAQSATAGTGASLATLLLGNPTAGSQTIKTNFNDYIRYYASFFQDDYRLTRRLTINLGMGLEYESGIQEAQNKLIVGFDPTTATPLQSGVSCLSVPGQVTYAGIGGNANHTGNPPPAKPGPRVGIAYWLDKKTVLQGGYGIFWAPSFFNFQNTIGYSQTTSIVTSTDGNFTPTGTQSNPYPNDLLQPSGNTPGGLSGVGQAITVFPSSTESAGYVQLLGDE